MILPLKAFTWGYYTWLWCRMPYKGYPNGCPMYNTRSDCPPQTILINEIFNLDHYHATNSINLRYLEAGSEGPNLYLIYQEFDIALQEYKMQDKHPDWTVKQCRCCRYYQRGLDKRIEEEAKKFIKDKENYIVLPRPEAYGLNCFSTFRFHEMNLEKNYEEQDKIVKMVLVGPAKEPVGLERWFNIEGR